MGVEIFQAFRPRDGEPGTVRAKVTLRELLTFREPNDAVGRAIRNAQLEALVRLVPVTVASQLLAVGLVAWSMRGMVADIWLALWFGFAWLLDMGAGAALTVSVVIVKRTAARIMRVARLPWSGE